MVGDNKKRYFSWKWFLSLVVLVILIWGVWGIFFSYATCETWDCFNSKLKDCVRTKFIGGDKMIFEYTIEGIKGDSCEVGVRLLQGELNNQDSIKLESREMTCMLPTGVIIIPESNIGICSGSLKEGLQDLIINKMHKYLVQNLARLNLEMSDLPGV